MIKNPNFRSGIPYKGKILTHPAGCAGIHNDDIVDLFPKDILWGNKIEIPLIKIINILSGRMYSAAFNQNEAGKQFFDQNE
jgi:hypothetical protein